ncbi:apoptosis-associated speck-like protein containing a CARD [Gastrophryne carolinensis]
MVRSVRDALVRALEDLEDRDLKKFCNTIRDWDIKEGYSRIPRSKLEGGDVDDIVNVIRDYYKDQYGAELTVAVLEDINQKNVAQELERNVGRGTKQNFVDQHRTDLIERVTAIDAILDSLLSQGQINQEAYDTIRIQAPPQEKMRKLYLYMRSWGDRHKDVFYDVLLTYEPCLVEDLQEQS